MLPINSSSSVNLQNETSPNKPLRVQNARRPIAKAIVQEVSTGSAPRKKGINARVKESDSQLLNSKNANNKTAKTTKLNELQQSVERLKFLVQQAKNSLNNNTKQLSLTNEVQQSSITANRQISTDALAIRQPSVIQEQRAILDNGQQPSVDQDQLAVLNHEQQIVSANAGYPMDIQELHEQIGQLETRLDANRHVVESAKQNKNQGIALSDKELCQRLISLLNEDSLNSIPEDQRTNPNVLATKLEAQILATEKQLSSLNEQISTMEKSDQSVTSSSPHSRNGWKIALATSMTGLIAAIVAGSVTLSKARSAEYEEEGDAAEAEALEQFIRTDEAKYNDPTTSDEDKKIISDRYIGETDNNGNSRPVFNTNAMLTAGNDAAAPTLQAARENAITTARGREQKGPAVGLGLGGILSLAGVVGSSVMLLKTRNKTPNLALISAAVTEQNKTMESTQLVRRDSNISTTRNQTASINTIRPFVTAAIEGRPSRLSIENAASRLSIEDQPSIRNALTDQAGVIMPTDLAVWRADDNQSIEGVTRLITAH